MKEYVKIARMLALFGQLGFTIVTPPVVLAILGQWLQKKFSLGSWVTLIAIILGLLTAAASAVQFWRRVMSAGAKEDQKEKTVVFYRHE